MIEFEIIHSNVRLTFPSSAAMLPVKFSQVRVLLDRMVRIQLLHVSKLEIVVVERCDLFGCNRDSFEKFRQTHNLRTKNVDDRSSIECLVSRIVLPDCQVFGRRSM